MLLGGGGGGGSSQEAPLPQPPRWSVVPEYFPRETLAGLSPGLWRSSRFSSGTEYNKPGRSLKFILKESCRVGGSL